MRVFRNLATGQDIPTGTAFRLGDINYPSNWLALATADDLAAHGIEAVELPDPEPVDPEPEPIVVTKRQLMLAALDVGLLDAMEALLPSLPRAAQIEWHHASLYERVHPMWDAAAAMMGKTPADVDALFALAGQK